MSLKPFPLKTSLINKSDEITKLLIQAVKDFAAIDEELLPELFNFIIYKTELHIVRNMLKNGMDVNRQDKDKNTILTKVAKCFSEGDSEMTIDRKIALVRIFTEYGADVNIPDKDGKTEFYFILTSRDFYSNIFNIGTLSRKQGGSYSLLHKIIQKNYNEHYHQQQHNDFHFNFISLHNNETSILGEDNIQEY